MQLKSIWTILFFISFTTGYACTCINLGKIDQKQFNEYDLIATGEILAVDFGEHTQKIEVGIHEVFKGKISKMTIVLSSSSQSGMCGIFPKVGEKWLIYAYGANAEFSTSLCTRTQNMTNANHWNRKIIEEDLIFLKKNTTRNKNH